jgi:hypothetical protein
MAAARAWRRAAILALAGCLACVLVAGAAAVGARASVKLSSASATLTQSGESEWTLTKSGTANTTAKTVTWTITATKTATVAGKLRVIGVMDVTNSGAAGATIGNIVVNLQTKQGSSWVTRSSDIADATSGDGATTAKVVKQASSEGKTSFTENAASGPLSFVDASNNTVFSLVPQKTIAPGATVPLLFVAELDNNELGLATGTTVRAEVIVSFGNSGQTGGGATASNIEINGNGTIDTDEDWVRSVPARFTLTVPAQANAGADPTLTDTLADITTTGTVTFSNATFNLGATSGTVTVSYNPGSSGGTITNCAHLEGAPSTVTIGGFTFPVANGTDLQACDTVAIGAHTCTPGAPGCGWQDGDLVTHTQTAWGTPASTAANLLASRFFSVYSSTGFVEIGIPGAAGFSAKFSSPTSIVTYLPSTGTPAALNADLVDPSSTASGSFGGEVLALTLNVDFAPYIGGSAGVALSSLKLCDVTPTSLNGTTVSSLLALANTSLGGGSSGYSISELLSLIVDVNAAFSGGSPSAWAQLHLFDGTCP